MTGKAEFMSDLRTYLSPGIRNNLTVLLFFSFEGGTYCSLVMATV